MGSLDLIEIRQRRGLLIGMKVKIRNISITLVKPNWLSCFAAAKQPSPISAPKTTFMKKLSRLLRRKYRPVIILTTDNIAAFDICNRSCDLSKDWYTDPTVRSKSLTDLPKDRHKFAAVRHLLQSLWVASYKENQFKANRKQRCVKDRGDDTTVLSVEQCTKENSLESRGTNSKDVVDTVEKTDVAETTSFRAWKRKKKLSRENTCFRPEQATRHMENSLELLPLTQDIHTWKSSLRGQSAPKTPTTRVPPKPSQPYQTQLKEDFKNKQQKLKSSIDNRLSCLDLPVHVENGKNILTGVNSDMFF